MPLKSLLKRYAMAIDINSRPHRIAAFALAFAVVTLGQTIYLLSVNKQYSTYVETIREREVREVTLAAGEEVVRVTGFGMDGSRRSVATSAAPSRSLIFTLSAGCPACQASITGFRRLAKQAIDHSLGVMWVSRDEQAVMARSDFSLHLGDFGSVIVEPTHATYLALKLKVVPQIALLSAAGIVERAWIGKLNDTVEEEIRIAITR